MNTLATRPQRNPVEWRTTLDAVRDAWAVDKGKATVYRRALAHYHKQATKALGKAWADRVWTDALRED